MKAVSKAQQRAAGAALSAKRGKTQPDALNGASREMFDTMTEAELDALASTALDGLPDHVAEHGPDHGRDQNHDD